MTSVTMLSVATRMNASGAKTPGLRDSPAWSVWWGRKLMPRSKALPMAPPARNTARREALNVDEGSASPGRLARSFASGRERGILDSLSNTNVSAAPADVTRHRCVDGVIVGVGCARQQGACGHDLAGLTIPALYDL